MNRDLSPTAEEVRELRLSLGLTQKDAADLVDRHVNRWSEWENGVYPMPGTLWEIFLLRVDKHPQYTTRSEPPSA
jgi:transcriptional regulator with XRE-family HTH domain